MAATSTAAATTVSNSDQAPGERCNGRADIDRDAYEIIVEEGGIDNFMEGIVCAEPETGLICLFEFIPL